MPNITKTTIARNASCNAITGQLNQGSLYPTGHLSIFTVDSTRITWHGLDSTAFGSSVDGTAVAYPISDATALFDATASSFAFENRDGSAVWRGFVSLNGGTGALQLETLILPQDSTIAISSAKYIVPA